MVKYMYNITQGMWTHRNNVLYHNQQSQTSTKTKEKLDMDIDTKLVMGNTGIRKRDANLITFDAKRVKKWHPGLQKQWLHSVEILRKCADNVLGKQIYEEVNTMDTELYRT